MFKCHYLLYLFLSFVMFCSSCDENDKSNELSNTMWVFPSDVPSQRVYYEFKHDKLFYFEYPEYTPGECIPLIYQADYKIKDSTIWIKKYNKWNILSVYKFKHDTLFLKDVNIVYIPDSGLPLVPYHKNDSTWIVCD